MKKFMALAIAACFSASAYAAGDAAAGQQKSQACAACHGADGNTPAGPDFPRLAGQREDYLLGARKNPIMAGQVSGLSTQDLADLAAFFSSQKGSLHVIR